MRHFLEQAFALLRILKAYASRTLPCRNRAGIETGGRLDASVAAQVDDAPAFYAMQVQGSGSIRLRDGTFCTGPE